MTTVKSLSNAATQMKWNAGIINANARQISSMMELSVLDHWVCMYVHVVVTVCSEYEAPAAAMMRNVTLSSWYIVGILLSDV
jgi:hypothetical protein